jgi:hypothetical protein
VGAVLGFELGAFHLLGRYFTTWAMPQNPLQNSVRVLDMNIKILNYPN